MSFGSNRTRTPQTVKTVLLKFGSSVRSAIAACMAINHRMITLIFLYILGYFAK